MKYVNCGCGNRYNTSSEWDNIDFGSDSPNVRCHNLLKGLPYENETVDVIFSSCMLEHFTLEEAKNHLKECCRCLKKGGRIRIVVPDLEDICTEYLKVLNGCKQGDQESVGKYEYILIEMIDQMTRTFSGGEMAKYWERSDRNETYIQERTGYPEAAKESGKLSVITKMRIILKHYRHVILSKWSVYRKYKIGAFMLSGEVHKWMYDEYGLRKILENAGFKDVKRMSVNVSDITN